MSARSLDAVSPSSPSTRRATSSGPASAEVCVGRHELDKPESGLVSNPLLRLGSA